MTFVFAMQLDAKVNYPIIVDSSREIIKQLNMIDLYEKDSTRKYLE